MRILYFGIILVSKRSNARKFQHFIKRGDLKSTCVLVPVPPRKVLVGVWGFQSKGDEVSLCLEGIVQLREQGDSAVPAVHRVPHAAREGLLAEESAVGAEEGHLEVVAARVGDAHVVHLAPRLRVRVEASVHSVRAREACLGKIVLVVHWEVNASFPKRIRKAKVVVRTVNPLSFWPPLRGPLAGREVGQFLSSDHIKLRRRRWRQIEGLSRSTCPWSYCGRWRRGGWWPGWKRRYSFRAWALWKLLRFWFFRTLQSLCFWPVFLFQLSKRLRRLSWWLKLTCVQSLWELEPVKLDPSYSTSFEGKKFRNILVWSLSSYFFEKRKKSIKIWVRPFARLQTSPWHTRMCCPSLICKCFLRTS